MKRLVENDIMTWWMAWNGILRTSWIRPKNPKVLCVSLALPLCPLLCQMTNRSIKKWDFIQSFKCSFQSSLTGEKECMILQTEVLTSTCPFEMSRSCDLPTLGAVLCLAYGLPVHGGEVRFSQVNREGCLNSLRLHMLLLRGRVYVVNAPGIEGTDGFLEALNARNVCQHEHVTHIPACTILNKTKKI